MQHDVDLLVFDIVVLQHHIDELCLDIVVRVNRFHGGARHQRYRRCGGTFTRRISMSSGSMNP